MEGGECKMERGMGGGGGEEEGMWGRGKVNN